MARKASTRSDDLAATKRSEDELPPDLLADIPSTAARRLIVAAVAEFSARGYHATTTRQISIRAGMSPAAMYVHYASKEEMLYDASTIAHAAAFRAVSQPAPEDLTPSARLRFLVRRLTLWHAEHPSLARIAQYDLGGLSPEHHAEIATIRRRTERIFRNAVEDGLTTGAFQATDVNAAVRAVMSMIIDVARWFRKDGPTDATTLATWYGDLAVRMLAGNDP